MNNTIYVHLGARKFNIGDFDTIKNNDIINKPFGGYWASPIDSENRWEKVFKLDEMQKKEKFTFKIRENANILKLTKIEDLSNLPIVEKTGFLDYEKLSVMYDAIYFESKIDKNLYNKLPEWMCDCILIMKAEVIIEIYNK